MRQYRYIIWLIALFLWSSTMTATELTLDSCLRMARAHHPMLQQAELEVLRAQEVKAQALTKYFPQVQGSAMAFHALHPVVEIGIDDIGRASVRDLLQALYEQFGESLDLNNTLSLFNHGYTVGVTALQPVFVGGKIVAGNKLAKVGVEAAQLQEQITQRDVLEQVEQSYWLVYGLQQKQHIIADATALVDTLYHTVSTAVEAGLALPSDLSQVTIQRDDIQRQAIQLESGLRIARSALALAIGQPIHTPIVAVKQALEIDTILLHNEQGQTPEQQLLHLQVRAAELQKYMAMADALPQIALGANYSYGHYQANILKDGLGGKTGNGALFVTVQVPLTAWWETSHKMREQQYAIDQARLQADYMGAQLQLRTQQAYNQMIDAQALLSIQERTVERTTELYHQTTANYQAGRATMAELLQAQMQMTQALTALTDAQISNKVLTQRYIDLVK